MQKYAQHYMMCSGTRSLMQASASGSTRSFGAIVKADGDHKFVATSNKKTIVFDGLKPTSNLVHAISNNYRH